MGSQPGQAEHDGKEEDVANLGFTPMVKVQGEWTVDKVLDAIPGGPPKQQPTSPLVFFHMLERLKTTKREGWRRFGIERGESIADHMYRMSLISMFAPPTLAPQLDLPKCVKMCLVHDMAELLVGDITPVDGVAKPEKSRREAASMDYLTDDLLRAVTDPSTSSSSSSSSSNSASAVGVELRAVWQEYEDAQTLDSRFVHDVDKMELLLQMVEYERRAGGQLDLGEFAYVARKMTLPEMRPWADEVLREREVFWGGQAHVHGEEGSDDGVPTDLRKQQDDYYNRGG